MVSPYSLGAQNAKTAFGVFVDGDLLAGAVTLTTAQTQATVAHGLSAAPDFCLMGIDAAASGGEGIGWSATATTLTIIQIDTQLGAVVSYLAGNLT